VYADLEAAGTSRAPRRKAHRQTAADTAGQRIHQESADHFQDELDKKLQHSSEMMALGKECEKAGKAGRYPTGTVLNFSRLFNFRPFARLT